MGWQSRRSIQSDVQVLGKAARVFQQAFRGLNQLSHIPEVEVTSKNLLDVPQGEVTEAGMRSNISVAIQYLDAWIQGTGAVAIQGLWRTPPQQRSPEANSGSGPTTRANGRRVNTHLYLGLRTEEVVKLVEVRTSATASALDKAVVHVDDLVINKTFTEFLTVPGDQYLE